MLHDVRLYRRQNLIKELSKGIIVRHHRPRRNILMVPPNPATLCKMCSTKNANKRTLILHSLHFFQPAHPSRLLCSQTDPGRVGGLGT